MLASPAPPPAVNLQAPLHIIFNAASGRNDNEASLTILREMLAVAKRSYHLTLVDNPAKLAEIARNTVAEAQKQGGIVVVAGGDGAISSVAQHVLGSGCPLGILPHGTFNYFARTHGIPCDIPEAVALLLNGQAGPVQVGLVNGRIFLVNASLGLYPKLLEDREAYKKQFGRSRMVALGAGLVSVLQQHRPLRIMLEHAGKTRDLRTPMLFIGNNALQLQQIGLPLDEALAQGQLAAIVPKPVGTRALLGLMLRGALGQLGEADNVTSFSFSQMVVKPRQFYPSRRIKVAMDGEIFWLTTPLEFRVSPEPLYLLKPPDGYPSAGSV